jgi:hypothetical protein
VDSGTWTAPAIAVLGVGGCTSLLFAILLPETRPGAVVLGVLLVVLSVLVAVAGLRSRRRTAGAGHRGRLV